MIEIVMDKERNLKNLKQVGTPRDEDRIYIENLAYANLQETNSREKRLFVLMGHTERMNGRYATFVEAVIPVRDVDFSGNAPLWNNQIWSEVYREIKRIYEDMIIVGWAVDSRGMSPSVTPELERIHRAHFGGAHQLLFLMDSLEKEETFYMYKENHLIPKDGFYVYYRTRRHLQSMESSEPSSEREEADADLQVLMEPLDMRDRESRRVIAEEGKAEEEVTFRGGRYRQLLQERSKSTEGSNAGLAIAVAMLLFVLIVGVYESRDTMEGKTPPTTEAGATQFESESDDTQADGSPETETQKDSNASESASETGYVIPVETAE